MIFFFQLTDRPTVTRATSERFCNLTIFFHCDAFFSSHFMHLSPSLFTVGRFLSAKFRALALLPPLLGLADFPIRTSTARSVLSIQTSLKLIDYFIHTSTDRSVISIQTSLKLIDSLIHKSTGRSVLAIQTSLDLDASID